MSNDNWPPKQECGHNGVYDLCPDCGICGPCSALRIDAQRLRESFLKFLTEDSPHHDMRKKDFNQAIFNKEEGWQVFNGTDLEMVMEKFDRAIKECQKLEKLTESK